MAWWALNLPAVWHSKPMGRCAADSADARHFLLLVAGAKLGASTTLKPLCLSQILTIFLISALAEVMLLSDPDMSAVLQAGFIPSERKSFTSPHSVCSRIPAFADRGLGIAAGHLAMPHNLYLSLFYCAEPSVRPAQ